MRVWTGTALLLVALTSVADADISKVNGSIRVTATEAAGEVSTVNGAIAIEDSARARAAESVNGSITIGRRASVGTAETVNGKIQLAEGAAVRSIETVNGAIIVGERARVEGDVSAVNSHITVGRDAHVRGSVENVNGPFEFISAHIGGSVRTVNGDIEVGAGARVDGDIHVKEPNSNWWNWSSTKRHVPRVVIGPNAVVSGKLTFEHEVDLYISNSAKVGTITGAKPKYFAGEKP